jgi:hypothetical protein
VLPPTPVWQTYVYHTTAEVMLTHLPQFCNAFFSQVPPAWQRAWAAWRTLSPTSLARIRRSLQAASRTPRRLHTPTLRATRTGPPTQRPAAHTRWTPHAVSVCNPPASTRHDPPHVVILAAAYLPAPEYSAALLPRSTGRGTFDVACFGEKRPRVLGRSAPCFGEKIPMITHYYRKD